MRGARWGNLKPTVTIAASADHGIMRGGEWLKFSEPFSTHSKSYEEHTNQTNEKLSSLTLGDQLRENYANSTSVKLWGRCGGQLLINAAALYKNVICAEQLNQKNSYYSTPRPLGQMEYLGRLPV